MIAKSLLITMVATIAPVVLCVYIVRHNSSISSERDEVRVQTFQKLNDARVFVGTDPQNLERALGVPLNSWVEDGKWSKRWFIGFPRQERDRSFDLRTYLIVSGTADLVTESIMLTQD